MPGYAGTAATSCRCAVPVPGESQALRTRRMVDALIRWPSLSSSPWIRWYPQPLFFGGEPLDQRGNLGADRRPSCPVRVGPLAGDQAAVPPQDGAGGDQPVHPQVLAGAGSARRGPRGRPSPAGAADLVRRSTATSCRSTSSSASLDADDRPSRTSQPQSRTKMRYSRRRDTDDHDALPLTLVIAAAHRPRRLLAPHTVVTWCAGPDRRLAVHTRPAARRADPARCAAPAGRGGR